MIAAAKPARKTKLKIIKMARLVYSFFHCYSVLSLIPFLIASSLSYVYSMFANALELVSMSILLFIVKLIELIIN